MRVLRAACLLLAVGLVLSFTPATAAPSGTATTINVTLIDDLSPRIAGRPTDFTATLAAGDVAVPNEVLTLWLHSAGTSTFVIAGQATTDASGHATVWATLESNVVAHWTHEASASYEASTSGDYRIGISPRVTARAHDRTLRLGQRLVVTGRTFPVKAGCTVVLWRGDLRPLTAGPAPVRLARAKARADGSYRLVRRFHKAASMRVAVTVAGCAGNDRGVSSGIRIRVR